MTTTFRQDTRTGMYAAIVAMQAAHPTVLREVRRVRPMHYNSPLPLAWVDILSEAASHSAGTRERVLSPSIVFIGAPIENDEQADQWDALVDLAADWFTAVPQFSPISIWDRWTVTDESEEVQTAPDQTRTFPIVRFTFTNVSLREGRS